MSFTVDAVRRLVNVPDITDEFILGYADDGYTEAIDVAIALCDYMASLTGANSKLIKVGPITIDKEAVSQNWQSIKDNLIKRKFTGAGVPCGIGLAGLTTFAGAVVTGSGCPENVWIGQFDNPPQTAGCDCE
jgi:hypothetical protein